MEPKWIFSSSSSLLNFQQEIYNLESQVLFYFCFSLSSPSLSYVAQHFFSLFSFTSPHHFGYISYVAASKEFNILIIFFSLARCSAYFSLNNAFIYLLWSTDWLAGWLNILNYLCYEKISFRFPFITQKRALNTWFVA